MLLRWYPLASCGLILSIFCTAGLIAGLGLELSLASPELQLMSLTVTNSAGPEPQKEGQLLPPGVYLRRW